MENVFYYLLNMSIIGAVVGMIVMLIRKIKTIPRRFAIILWIIPFLRFVLPFGIVSEVGLISFVSRFYGRTIPSANPFVSTANVIMQAEEYDPLTFAEDGFFDFLKIASIIWALVAIAAILVLSITYIAALREIKGSRKSGDIYYSSNVAVPAVYGIFKPKIVLPSFLEKEDNSMILLHERAHIHRLDNLWRLTAVLTACLHWFNPFAWMFLKRFLEDMELACDESVMKGMEEKNRAEYASCLLDFSCKRTLFTSSFVGASVHKRIQNILSYKRLTIASAVTFILIIVISFVFLLTNAPIY